MAINNTYTAKNSTDLLQAVNFTNLMQHVNKMQQGCQYNQVATSLLKFGLLQLVIFAVYLQLFDTTCNKSVDIKFGQSTCNKSADNLQQTCCQQAVKSPANIS